LYQGLALGLLEEAPQRPVGVAHGGQVRILRAMAADRRHRQRLRQRIGRVVGQRLQQRIEGFVRCQGAELLHRAVEHVLVGDAPGRVSHHRVDIVATPDEAGHALVAEEAELVVPGEIAVVDVDVVERPGAEQLRQPGEAVAAFR